MRVLKTRRILIHIKIYTKLHDVNYYFKDNLNIFFADLQKKFNNNKL